MSKEDVLRNMKKVIFFTYNQKQFKYMRYIMRIEGLENSTLLFKARR